MAKKGKKYTEVSEALDSKKSYTVDEAIKAMYREVIAQTLKDVLNNEDAGLSAEAWRWLFGDSLEREMALELADCNLEGVIRDLRRIVFIHIVERNCGE